VLRSAAAINGLPFEFFALVIWQESRFKSDAVGPLTRGGQRAQGIAQFMPVTAAERLLHDPFDPAEALPNRPHSCGSCETNWAIWDSRRRPTMRVPNVSVTGLPESGLCRRKRKPMSAS
jgi:Transglycosylase SLT domain